MNLRQRDRFVKQENQIRSGLGMRESEIEPGASSLGVRDAVLAPASDEDFRQASAGGASPHEQMLAAAVGCIISGRIILPLIDSTTMAANSRAASRLNSTSCPPRRK